MCNNFFLLKLPNFTCKNAKIPLPDLTLYGNIEQEEIFKYFGVPFHKPKLEVPYE